ncbi:hypothetical protein BDFB_009497 [Asbolus verrucosus]|uniref:Secreted protein n=1 Tax=Asbolus verrucosus TaxID=1661398 RepID=A0A482W4N7_ASBVE|nr:hypothetical protein BDFB_009497 [Asbolus verrucosus]
MALLARLWKSLKALTSLGDLLLKLVTQTLLDLSLAAASSVLSPRSRCTSRMSRHSITSSHKYHQSPAPLLFLAHLFSRNTGRTRSVYTPDKRTLLITRNPGFRHLLNRFC